MTELRFTPAARRPVTVIEDAATFALAVFTLTKESLRRFDERAAMQPRDGFVREDIDAMNSVMSTRTSAEALLKRAERSTERLRLLDESWSMTTMSPADWNQQRVTVKVAAAVRAFGASWPSVAVVSKLLYLKRPDLMPIIDGYVIDHLGPVDGLRGAIRLFRENCVANQEGLLEIQHRLAAEGIDRTPVRILETCLWAAHPRSPVHLEAGSWEHVVRRVARS